MWKAESEERNMELWERKKEKERNKRQIEKDRKERDSQGRGGVLHIEYIVRKDMIAGANKVGSTL
jgi:hypothetical protein